MKALRNILVLPLLIMLGCTSTESEVQESNQQLNFGHKVVENEVATTANFRTQINESNIFKGTIKAMLVEACDTDCDVKVSVFDGRDIYVNCNGFELDVEKYIDHSILISGEAHKDPNTNRVVFDASGILIK